MGAGARGSAYTDTHGAHVRGRVCVRVSRMGARMRGACGRVCGRVRVCVHGRACRRVILAHVRGVCQEKVVCHFAQDFVLSFVLLVCMFPHIKENPHRGE